MFRITCYKLILFLALYPTVLFSLVGCRPQVQYEGKKYIREGSPFTITCKKSPYGPPKWTKDGVALVSSEGNRYKFRHEKEEDNIKIMTLSVDSAHLQDKGEYKCDAMSNISHRIEVIPSAEMDDKGSQNIVLLRPNENLELHCAEVDLTVIEVKWYKDEHRILESNRIEFSGPSLRNLLVKNATEEDAGDYRCSGGSDLLHPVNKHSGYFIKVTYKARVEKFPSQMQPIFGRNFTLECKVHGYPVPRVTWFIDDEPGELFIQNHSRMSILENEQGLPDSVLFIEDVNYVDNHMVKCKAKNFQGYEETSVLLAVRENIVITNEPYPGKGIILSPGSNLVLQCNNTDDPQMRFAWQKNGKPINTTDERIDLKMHNILTIVKAVEGDTGNYMCVPSEEGVNEEANATIVVRTEIKLLPFDHSRNIVEGQNIVLICNATQGMPLPTLQWLKDGEALNLSDPRVSIEADDKGIDATKLTIKEAEFDDRAEYTCVATNDVGSVNASILVRVKDKYAALWPFLGICAEVAILCTIIFIYEKKRQKPDYDESEADHNTENKTVPDQEDKSQDVRQRK